MQSAFPEASDWTMNSSPYCTTKRGSVNMKIIIILLFYATGWGTTLYSPLLKLPMITRNGQIMQMCWWAEWCPAPRYSLFTWDHYTGLSNSRNEYTVLDDLSSQGPLNLWICYKTRNNALPVIIGLQYIRDWPSNTKSGNHECQMLINVTIILGCTYNILH